MFLTILYSNVVMMQANSEVHRRGARLPAPTSTVPFESGLVIRIWQPFARYGHGHASSTEPSSNVCTYECAAPEPAAPVSIVE